MTTMRAHRFFSLTALAALAAVLSAPAQAAGGYAFAGAGRSHQNLDCSGLSDCKSNGTAYRLGGGYRLDSGLAFEGLYLNLGESAATSQGVRVTIKADAIGGGAAYFLPFSPSWTGVARLGVASVKAKATGRLGSVAASLSDRTTQAYAGLGISYTVSPGFYVEASYDATRGELEGDKSNLSALALSVGFRF